jgi:hypothetical protein
VVGAGANVVPAIAVPMHVQAEDVPLQDVKNALAINVAAADAEL